MLTPDKIERLNFLARKKKAGSQTAEEAREHQELRDEYMTNFRTHIRGQLDSIKFVEDLDGDDVKH